jgi:transposase-like protein
MRMETTQFEVVDQMQKRDRRGRRITSGERRAQLLEAYEHSGMTQAQFARQHGIVYQTFASWVQSRRRRKAVPASPGARHFAQVQLAREANAPVVGAVILRARFADGLELSASDAGALAALIISLRG